MQSLELTSENETQIPNKFHILLFVKNKVHNGKVGTIFERTQEKYSCLLSTVELH